MSAHKHTHTQGPWSYAKTLYGARVETMGKYGMQGIVWCDCSVPKFKENIRLIAAAPELLDALETIVAKCDEETTFYSTEDIINKARAAIAKATGETEVKP